MKRRDLFTLKTNKPIEEIAPKQDLYPNHLSRTTAGLEPYIPSTDQPWDYSRAAHLLRRTMIGPKDIEIREVISLGLDKTLERLFQPATISTKEIEPWCFAEPQIRAVPAGSGIPGLSDPEFPSQNILRREILTRWYAKTIAVSGMNLQERMVMFWTGILTSEIDVVQVSEWMFNQQTLLRKHCLGNLNS